MAAKVETLQLRTPAVPSPRKRVKAIGAAMRRWVQRGQLGSSNLEMRAYTGAR